MCAAVPVFATDDCDPCEEAEDQTLVNAGFDPCKPKDAGVEVHNEPCKECDGNGGIRNKPDGPYAGFPCVRCQNGEILFPDGTEIPGDPCKECDGKGGARMKSGDCEINGIPGRCCNGICFKKEPVKEANPCWYWDEYTCSYQTYGILNPCVSRNEIKMGGGKCNSGWDVVWQSVWVMDLDSGSLRGIPVYNLSLNRRRYVVNVKEDEYQLVLCQTESLVCKNGNPVLVKDFGEFVRAEMTSQSFIKKYGNWEYYFSFSLNVIGPIKESPTKVDPINSLPCTIYNKQGTPCEPCSH